MAVEQSDQAKAKADSNNNKGFWPGFITGIFSLIVVGGLLGFLLSPELLKHRSPFPLEEAIGASRVSAAIPGDYKNKPNPVPASDETALRGRQVFNSNCAFCHGTTGKGEAPLGRNLFPPAANLLESKTLEKTDGEIYWILQNGLSFVGMPAFGSTLSSDDLWKTIQYLRALQKGTAEKLGSLPATPAPAAVATAPATVRATPPPAYAAAPTTANAVAPVAPAAPATTAPDQAARGLALFRNQGCSGCHGGDLATGELGPRIANPSYPLKDLLRQVRSGGGSMPPYSTGQISDAEVELIYNYLKTLK